MKYQDIHEFSFLLDENHYAYHYTESMDAMHIYVKSRPHSCCCPKCGSVSRHLHSTYSRTLQDTPIHCKKTLLHLNVYKYDCLNPHCSQKVFTESLPFAKTSQVRTDALNTMILAVSMFLSNEGASNVLALMGITVSNDSIQKLYDRILFRDMIEVEAIGVDDVAIRKGQTYATAVYDLKSRRLLALLEGREAENLEEWLLRHKQIKLVARDRASAYASAISKILPECTQVADRFHLLQNLIKKLRDIFQNDIPKELYLEDGKLQEVPPKKLWVDREPDLVYLSSLTYDNSPPFDSEGNEIHYDRKRRSLNSKAYKERDEKKKKTRTD